MALAGLWAQTILFGVQPSGTGWVGWVVLAVIVFFMALTVLGIIRGKLRSVLMKWRSRHLVSGSPTVDDDLRPPNDYSAGGQSEPPRDSDGGKSAV
jgi:hypothetical protein